MVSREEAEKFGADFERANVWDALSEFYLDTELDERDKERIAGTLARSPFSLEELRYIELFEVHPVCIPNLFCVAGVWGGFSADWLIPRCLRLQQRKPFSEKRLQGLGYRFWNRVVPTIIDRKRIEELRASST